MIAAGDGTQECLKRGLKGERVGAAVKPKGRVRHIGFERSTARAEEETGAGASFLTGCAGN